MRALFGATYAKVFWDAPSPLSWQGRGVYRGFRYSVDVEEISSGKRIATIENIRERRAAIEGLMNATKYRVTVKAYSELKAPGPVSSVFAGSTLSSSADQLVWSTIMTTAGNACH